MESQTIGCWLVDTHDAAVETCGDDRLDLRYPDEISIVRFSDLGIVERSDAGAVAHEAAVRRVELGSEIADYSSGRNGDVDLSLVRLVTKEGLTTVIGAYKAPHDHCLLVQIDIAAPFSPEIEELVRTVLQSVSRMA